MSMVGFDIGNENCVIATVKLRSVDVLLNDESNRETPGIVCFGEKQRFVGTAGAASAVMNPKSTVSQVKKLIGRRFREPDVQNELKRLPFESCESPDGGIWIKLKYLGEMHTFTPVQIMAMLFAHLKHISEKSLVLPVTDCVIGIPSYFTDLQRREYLNAAMIAGLKPLKLIHDCTATALGYGIYKTDFADRGMTNLAFVDIGHSDTQVSIVSFDAACMRILSHAFDSSLGGRDFDEVLFSHFAAQFKDEYKINVYSNVRACIRLRAACEKLKKILSANAEAPLNIECLMDEKDVKGFIKREEFEKLASSLLERITVPCKKALADAGLQVDKIHSVEIVGSGSRIPAISKLIKSVFKREPSRTLNASECVARGCAFQCAVLSPVFRIKEYEVQDSLPFSIGIASEEGLASAASNPKCIVFPKGQPLPSAKVLQFHRSSSFRLEVYYAIPDELPVGVASKISAFMIGPFEASQNEKAKVKVKVKLNIHGIVAIESALLIDHVDDSATKDNGHQGMGQTKSEGVQVSYKGGHDNGDTKSSHPSVDGVAKDKAGRKVQIPVSETVYGGTSKAELSKAQQKEVQLAEQDRAMEQTKDKKNALESFVYDTRNKLFNTYRSFASEQERERIARNLQQTEEWLYDEGDDETATTYTLKLNDLKKLVDPVEIRYKDGEARGEASRNLINFIVDYRTAADSLPTEAKELIRRECNKAEEWLREKSQEQNSRHKYEEPVLWSSEITSRTEDLRRKCEDILSRVKASPASYAKKSSKRGR